MEPQIYFEHFEDREDIERHFKCKLENSIQILFAYYGDISSTESDSFVVFMQNGKLFENVASHCSCFGLEHQWEPDETTGKALLYGLEHGKRFRFGETGWADQARKNMQYHLELLIRFLADKETKNGYK